MSTKTCSKCKEVKPVEAFSKDRKARDGLNYKCRECAAAANHRRSAGYAIRNKDRDPYADGGEKRCPDCGLSKPVQEFSINLHQRDGLQVVCKTCGSVRKAKHKRERPDLYRASVQRRRARKADAPGDGLTPERDAQLRERFGWSCFWCAVELGEPGNAEQTSAQIDHVHPLSSERPSHLAGDLVWACRSCNVSRGNTPALEYAQRVWGVEFSDVSWEMTTRVLEAARRNVFPT